MSSTRLAALPMLAGAGVLVGTWALVPRYGGPRLELGPRGSQLEFVDHVLPGTLVIVLSVLALLLARRPSGARRLFPLGVGIVLAGLWMCATHFPLVLQATRNEAPWLATLHHSSPGVAVLALGVGWCLLYRVRPSSD
ncbi:MAG: hypothetical protein ACR2K2_10955 [Mycobacteriales bacterium]